MEQSSNNQYSYSVRFILVGLLLLVVGMVFGMIGAFQYVIPGALKEFLSFEKIRPMHVSSVVFWIISGSIGCVLTYLQEHSEKKLYSQMLIRIQWYILTSSILIIIISYCFGIFGGREYWEFHPFLAIPIVLGWILFLVNVIKSIGSICNQPVYVWMWLTGVVFFLFTFCESYLWIFPYFRNNVVNDMTVQWKSYGSMVGSWNMLIYGSSIFLIQKISKDKNYAHSRIAFLLYFTGLFNLMFNWGHHIYTLPTHGYVKNISYAVSMTELFIIGRILFQWKNTVSSAQKFFNSTAYRLILAADGWIFLTLLLAIAMSIPAINIYTHGTHVTVAHTMGATIGINSFLLLAITFDILKGTDEKVQSQKKHFMIGYWMANCALFIFWLTLILAGAMKAQWQLSINPILYKDMMLQLHPYFVVFLLSGVCLFVGISIMILPLVKTSAYRSFYQKQRSK